MNESHLAEPAPSRLTNPFNRFPESADSNPFPESVDSHPFQTRPRTDARAPNNPQPLTPKPQSLTPDPQPPTPKVPYADPG
jgi:hypothetical protein